MLNKVNLIGNLGKDPEYKNINGQDNVSFTVATTKKWKDKNGTKQEKTEWHNVVAWGGLAKTIAEWVGKGNKVYLEGELQTRSWEKDNITRYSTEIIANQLIMLGEAKKAQNTGRAAQQATPAGTNAGYYNTPGFDEADNDLPF